MDEIPTRKRDTSWVEGEIATSLDNFPDTVRRRNTSSRYYLVDEDTFKDLIEADLLDHRNYWMGKFSCEDFALGFASRFWQRFSVNGVGVVVDFHEEDLYNIVVYEEGGVEFYDPNAKVLVQPRDFEPEAGLILL